MGHALKTADIHDQGAGVYRKVMIDSDVDGSRSCGMVGPHRPRWGAAS